MKNLILSAAALGLAALPSLAQTGNPHPKPQGPPPGYRPQDRPLQNVPMKTPISVPTPIVVPPTPEELDRMRELVPDCQYTEIKMSRDMHTQFRLGWALSASAASRLKQQVDGAFVHADLSASTCATEQAPSAATPPNSPPRAVLVRLHT